MRSMATWRATLLIGLLAFTPGVVPAGQHDHSKLPPGPIRDRHELMKSMGEEAQAINDAFNMGAEGMDTGVIQRGAQVISMNAARIPTLFPKGSTDPNSRALPKIWDNWDKFEQLAKQLQDRAMALSNAAGSQTDENFKEKSDKVFATCKSCHDQFRRPKKTEKGK
jgi:cytochrome c556